MYFSPSAKCFYEDVFSKMLHTILSELLRQSFQLVLIKYQAVQSQHFKLPDILVACSTAALNKSNLQRINNKKIIKRRRSRPEVFSKKGVARNDAKFTGKQLYQCLFLMAQVLFCEFGEILKSTYSYGRSPVAASENGIQKKKSNKNEIFSLQYKHKFRIMLKNTLNNKIQESWISHAWVMHR